MFSNKDYDLLLFLHKETHIERESLSDPINSINRVTSIKVYLPWSGKSAIHIKQSNQTRLSQSHP